MSSSFALARITSTLCCDMGCNVLFRRSLMSLVSPSVVGGADALILHHGTARYQLCKFVQTI